MRSNRDRRGWLARIALGCASFCAVSSLAMGAESRLGESDPTRAPHSPREVREMLDAGRYAAAEIGARRLLARSESETGPESLETARALDLLVEILLAARKLTDPDLPGWVDRAVRLKERTAGLDDPETATSLLGLGRLHASMWRHAAAESLYERCLSIRERALGPNHPDVAMVLEHLATTRLAKRDRDAAQALSERAVAIREPGPESPELAKCLVIRADVLAALRRAAEAKPLVERALVIQEKVLGPEHPQVAATLASLAILRASSDNYEGAKKDLERALAIREKVLGPESADVGSTLALLGRLHMDMGEYPAAKALLERALGVLERSLGPDHPELGTAVNDLGWTFKEQGEYSTARTLCERALSIWTRALGPEHRSVAIAMGYIGSVELAQGNYRAAIALARRALSIFEKIEGPEGTSVAAGLVNLANALDEAGDYAAAPPLYERAASIYEKRFGPESHFVAITLLNYGLMLEHVGEEAPAVPLLERALAIEEKAVGPNHPNVAHLLQSLAWARYKARDFAAAVALDERALAILTEAFGPEHPMVARQLGALAEVLQAMGDHAAARQNLERALAIEEQSLGADHPQLATTLKDLAHVLLETGDPAAARSTAERALAMGEAALGPTHPYVADYREMLALALDGLGDRHGALDMALRAEDVWRGQRRLGIRVLPERQALRYAAARPGGLDEALKLVADGPDPSVAVRVWDALIRSRAAVLDEICARHRSLAASGEPELVALAEALTAARERLANLVVRGPADEPPERYRAMIAAARTDKEHAERALAEKNLSFRKELELGEVGFEAVRAALPLKSALVAFARYNRMQFGAGSVAGSGAGDSAAPARPRFDAVASYVAFVLHGEKREAKVVPLGPADEIEALVAAWRREAARGALEPGRSPRQAEIAYRSAAAALRRRVWDPVAGEVAGARRVFLVPDGALHLMNLAALPDGDAGYLLEGGPAIHHLSAERDLVPVDALPRGTGLLALGSPAFDAASPAGARGERRRSGRQSSGSSAGETSSVAPSRSEAEVSLREGTCCPGRRSGCGEFDALRFHALPASGHEAREVAGLWKRSAGRPRSGAKDASHDPAGVVELTGAAASEAAFKEEAPGKRVLHVATHGFFLGTQCPSVLDAQRGIGGLGAVGPSSAPPVTGENPLILSGLALAGANRRGSASPDQDDGILTAEEIAALDLVGVDWAVLSACDTGVGEVRAGEGVFGLRRAFQVAGARTSIMSLWSVDDEAARKWMKALYEGRLVEGKDTAQCVRDASLKVLGERRRKHESTHPFFWAAFVAAGDWR